MKTRKPSVAGQFYPGNKQELDKLLDDIIEKEKDQIKKELARKNIIGAVVPHAGYVFSAYQAVHVFQILKEHSTQFDTIFIINPNHSGMGNEIAFDANDYWETPYGKVEVDKDFAETMNLPVSEIEQSREHSGEVMVPLLQRFLDYNFKIAPVTMTMQTHSNAHELANEIFNANKKLNKNIFIIASSDFSHFVTPKAGEEQDQLVIDKINSIQPEEVEKVIRKNRISVCGYGPIMALMEYSKLVTENPKNEVLKKGSSGDVIPSNEVVDYVSFLFYS
ncbi:MAG: AmmeMemoRadiSam system protein B [Bacteroidota bacterium]